MDQQTKNALRAIPLDTSLTDALEVISTSFTSLAGQLESMMGPQSFNSLVPITKRMHAELRAKLGGRMSFESMFTGQGNKARKLREFVNLGNALCGDSGPTHTARFDAMLNSFAYPLTSHPPEIARWEVFKRRVGKLLSQGNDDVAPVLLYEGVKSGFDEHTGFYVTPGTFRGAIKHLVLAGTMPGSEVQFVLRAATFEDPVVILWHPLEGAWAAMDEHLLLEGLMSALHTQLEEALEDLETTHADRDWVQAYEELVAVASTILSGPARHLPPTMRAFSRDKDMPIVQEIKLVHNEHTLLLRHTGGAWPSFTAEVYVGSVEAMAFTTPFAELAPTLQKQLVVALERELAWLKQQLPHHTPARSPRYDFRMKMDHRYNYK